MGFHLLWYKLGGHTTDTIGVLSQDCKPLVYKNGVQAPNGKEVYNPHYTKPKPRPKC
jgi:hypothetical protein